MPRLVDIRKAIEAIVYVSHKNGDLFHVVKIFCTMRTSST